MFRLLPSGLTPYYFNFDSVTGRISVKENLKNDISTQTYYVSIYLHLIFVYVTVTQKTVHRNETFCLCNTVQISLLFGSLIIA